MKRFFRKIHLWLLVPFGVVITLICFSGAMLVFEKEMTYMADDRLRMDGGEAGRALPMGVLAAKAAAELPEEVRITGVSVSGDPCEPYRMSLSKPRKAYLLVNQYTGEVLGRGGRTPFFAAMFSLHRWLLDKGRPEGRPAYGKIVVGVSTIMFVVALLSGVAVWWPKTRRALAAGLKITLRQGRLRLWRSLHVAGGMYAIVLLLVMALTGLTWSFPWYNKAFYSLLGVEAAAGKGSHGGARAAVTDGGAACWQAVYDRLRADNPHAPSITVGCGTASVSLGGLGNTRAADRYTFDPSTGRITSVARYADAAPGGKTRGWVYSLHTGTFGGWITRILWFVAAMIGAALPLTGYYLWVRRMAARRRAKVKIQDKSFS